MSLPFIPFNDTIDCVMQFVQQSVPWFLTFGFKSAVAVDLSVLQTALDTMDDWWINNLRPQVSTNCTLVETKVTDLTTQFSSVLAQAPTASPTGALAGAVLPAQAAIVTTLLTNNRGRSYRGRSFLAGRVDADMQTVTTWTATRQAGVVAAYIQLVAKLAAAGFTLSVLSRQENNVRRTLGVATAVTGLDTKVQIATQRRRLI